MITSEGRTQGVQNTMNVVHSVLYQNLRLINKNVKSAPSPSAIDRRKATNGALLVGSGNGGPAVV